MHKCIAYVACFALLVASALASGSEFQQQQQAQFMEQQSITCPALEFSHGLNLVADGANTNYELWFSPLTDNWAMIDYVDVHFIVNPQSDDFLAQHNWKMDFDPSLGIYWTQDNMGEALLSLQPTDTIWYFFTYSYIGVQCDSEWLQYTVPGMAIPAEPFIEQQQHIPQQMIQEPQQIVQEIPQQMIEEPQQMIQEPQQMIQEPQQMVEQQPQQMVQEIPQQAAQEIPKTEPIEIPKTEEFEEPEAMASMDSEWSASSVPSVGGYSGGGYKGQKGYSKGKQSYGKSKGYGKQSYGKEKGYSKQSYGQKDKGYGGKKSYGKQSYGKQSYGKGGYKGQQSYAPQQSYQQSYQQSSQY